MEVLLLKAQRAVLVTREEIIREIRSEVYWDAECSVHGSTAKGYCSMTHGATVERTTPAKETCWRYHIAGQKKEREPAEKLSAVILRQAIRLYRRTCSYCLQLEVCLHLWIWTSRVRSIFHMKDMKVMAEFLSSVFQQMAFSLNQISAQHPKK